jgi:uncharacterized membrane protein
MELTKKQIKKYKWQFISTMISAFFIAIVMIGGIVMGISIFFETENVFVLAIIVVLCDKGIEYYKTIHRDLLLIGERIEKRKIKNKKLNIEIEEYNE